MLWNICENQVAIAKCTLNNLSRFKHLKIVQLAALDYWLLNNVYLTEELDYWSHKYWPVKLYNLYCYYFFDKRNFSLAWSLYYWVWSHQIPNFIIGDGWIMMSLCFNCFLSFSGTIILKAGKILWAERKPWRNW